MIAQAIHRCLDKIETELAETNGRLSALATAAQILKAELAGAESPAAISSLPCDLVPPPPEHPPRKAYRRAKKTPPANADPPAGKNGRGLRQSVRSLWLDGKLGPAFTVEDVYSHLPADTPRKRISDALYQASTHGEIKRVGYGRYEIVAEKKTAELTAPDPALTSAQAVRAMVTVVLREMKGPYTMQDLIDAVGSKFPGQKKLWGAMGAISECHRKMREAGEVAQIEGEKRPSERGPLGLYQVINL